jgi:FKBP-type peptidyl-prolyl cis-trans isomerase 2
MVQAGSGDTVKVHYTGKLNDGTVFDSSRERDPLEFTVGQQQLIPGFENAIVGMEPGESKVIDIPPEEAYGPHDPGMVIEVDKGQLPPEMPLTPGARVQGSQPGGGVVEFTLTSIGESSVTLDGNHPLAGRDLKFEIELVSIA